MVNFNASVNSNNTALRKDSAGNASRNRLKDRRSERALEDTAAETARLLALKEEIDAENRATEGGSKEEMKQLNKDLRESKRRIARLEEELSETTAALDRLEALSTDSETQLSHSTDVDAIKAQLRDKTTDYKATVAKIVQLEVQVATLQEGNSTFQLRLQQVTAEKDALVEQCEQYEREQEDRPVGDRQNAAVIGKMEERYMKLEADRDNLQGNLKAAQLKYSQLERELAESHEDRPAANESEVINEIHDLLDGLVDSSRRGKGGDVCKRVDLTVSELKALRESARRAAAAESNRPSSDAKDHKIRTLEDKIRALDAKLDKTDAKFTVKRQKIKQLREEIEGLQSALLTQQQAAAVELERALQSQSTTIVAAPVNGRRESTGSTESDSEEKEALQAALALAERKVEGLEARLSGVEGERDELLTMQLRRRAPSDGGDNASASASIVQSTRAREGVTRMAATIRDLNEIITALREENLNLIIASVGV